MLNINLPLSSALELKPATTAELCEAALEIDDLVDSLDAGHPFTRKTLCEYLGIGESTLSGWLKEGRIPRMAKNAIVLLEAQQMLAAEVRRLRANDLYVVRSGDRYQVCELVEDDAGEIVGRVLANNISSIEDARLLASGRRALGVMREIDECGVFDYAHDMSDNQAFLGGVSCVEREIAEHELFVTDYEQWRAKFGRKCRARLLDDLLADTPPSAERQP